MYRSKRSAGFTLVEIMIMVAIIGLLASIAVPSFVKARLTAQRTGCISNLRAIDGAKEGWGLDNQKGPGSAVDEAAVNSYMKAGAPNCPGGGTYTYGNLDVKPTCSVAGHTI